MLRELQQCMLEGLWSSEPAPEALELLSKDHTLTPEQQLSVYRGSICGSLTKALSEVYPVCRRLVGERFFAAVAGAFVRQERSRSPDLNEYGETFGDFLAGFAPAAMLPYLPDVARLEWAWHRAFHGADSAPLELDVLAREVALADPDRVVFRLQKNAILVESPYAVHLIWQANQPDHDGEEVVDLSRGGASLLVWRRGTNRLIEPLEPRERCLLQALAHGLALGDVCLRLASEHPEVDLGVLLAAAFHRGWIAGFELA
jgi:hypothetical protein